MYQKLLALSTFCGTIIGVGLFGLPYVTAKVGFLPMIFYFLVLGAVMTLIHLIYGEIVLRTPGKHRLPGYNRLYLKSPLLEALSYLSTIVGLTGALLAYLVVGGEFLTNLLQPYLGGSPLLYSSVFFSLGFLMIYFGSGPVSKTEFFSLGIFFFVQAVLLAKALPYLEPNHFTTAQLNPSNFFLPYGVILFSLDGTSVIPEMREILKGRERALKNMIIVGSIIPIISYLIFIVTVYGVTGSATTPEALAGLNAALGNGGLRLGFVFGILTTFTSFLTLGITLKKEFQYDRKLPALLSAVLACLPAYLLYLAGLKDFIGIIGFVGAGALGIDLVVIMAIYLKAKTSRRTPAYSLRLPGYLLALLIILFLAGVGLELTHVFTP